MWIWIFEDFVLLEVDIFFLLVNKGDDPVFEGGWVGVGYDWGDSGMGFGWCGCWCWFWIFYWRWAGFAAITLIIIMLRRRLPTRTTPRSINSNIRLPTSRIILIRTLNLGQILHLFTWIAGIDLLGVKNKVGEHAAGWVDVGHFVGW